MRKLFGPLVVILLVLCAGAVNIQAQTAPASDREQLAASNATPLTSKTAPLPQSVINSLASLPEADGLIYINPQRIFNEVLPKFLPPKDLEEMRKGFEAAKQQAGIDPAKIDYVVMTIRFKKPTADLNFQAPEILVVSSGDFSAEALIGLARVASGGKLRDEKYGSKTIELITIDQIAKESEKTPLLKSFSEFGVVALNANTIAAGSPGYLREAIDASEGRGHISKEALSLLVRDPNALISYAGSPIGAFTKSFGMQGTETNPRAPRCDSKIGDFYAALTMDASNFMIRGVSNADNPDTAKIVANLYTMLLRYATSSIKDPAAQSLLTRLSIAAEGDEVLFNADFPQQMVMDLIQQQMKPKKPVETTDVKSITKPTTHRRRRGRRH
ncbi:MAG TPA: hypothetical protein VGO56_03020 [Pyrinomonadaceae bacterium]|nr:hypothetical protein [Pyrinomonadaceae bacterium]